jgi:hypothetical protein
MLSYNMTLQHTHESIVYFNAMCCKAEECTEMRSDVIQCVAIHRTEFKYVRSICKATQYNLTM